MNPSNFCLTSDIQNVVKEGPFTVHGFHIIVDGNLEQHMDDSSLQHQHNDFYDPVNINNDMNICGTIDCHSNMNPIVGSMNIVSSLSDNIHVTIDDPQVIQKNLDQQISPNVCLLRTMHPHELDAEQDYRNKSQSAMLVSPDVPTNCVLADRSSTYTNPIISPYADSTTFMDTETQVSGFEVTKPNNFIETTTQATLIANTDGLTLNSINVDNKPESHVKLRLDVTKLDDKELQKFDRAKNAKVPRMHEDLHATPNVSPTVDTVFRANEAQQEVPSDFTFTLFGQEQEHGANIGVFPFGVEITDDMPGEDIPVPAVVESSPFKTPQSVPHNVVKQQRERIRRAKEPILCQAFPSKFHSYELRILQQPEEQHRARYLTEGSRGAVKNRSGNGYPIVKLLGYTGVATLQVFIGTDTGRIRPHGFYQACKVCGKNSTPCNEKDVDGTTVIEVELNEANEMAASIDCVGILKLRNADVEQRIGIAKAKKKSTKARMVYRAIFQKPCGNAQVLQVASSTILCTQAIGEPEICKMSLQEAQSPGGNELFIIGKNFLKGAQVFFQQVTDDDVGHILWEKEGEIDKDYFQTTHMIVTVPKFGGQFKNSVTHCEKVQCQVVVNCVGKTSEPQPFHYISVEKQEMVTVKTDVGTAEESESRKRNYPFVAPETLELNQHTQQAPTNSDLFQLPSGVLKDVSLQQTSDYTAMEQGCTSNVDDNPADSKNVALANFASDLEQGTSKDDQFLLTHDKFEHVNLDSIPVPLWSSKNADNAFDSSGKADTEFESINFNSMSSEDFPANALSSVHDLIKSHGLSADSHGLSADGFPLEDVDMLSQSVLTKAADGSIVSKFLQHMALKSSDPMIGGGAMLISQNKHQSQCNNIQSDRDLLMVSDKQGHIMEPEKSVSYLKEDMACSSSSLESLTFGNINTSVYNADQACSSECIVSLSDMDLQIDNVKNVFNFDYLQQPDNSDDTSIRHNLNHSSLKQSHPMEYVSVNNMASEIHVVDLTCGPKTLYLSPRTPFSNSTLPFSNSGPHYLPDTVVSSTNVDLLPSTQTVSANSHFSPTDVLTTFNLIQQTHPSAVPVAVYPQSQTQPAPTASCQFPFIAQALDHTGQASSQDMHHSVQLPQSLHHKSQLSQAPATTTMPSVQLPTSSTPVGFSLGSQSTSNPLAPQIIICNSQMAHGFSNQLPAANFSSPSIVIMPGASGPDNRMENLLRSILGSMLQPQQQTPQQQMPQQQMPQQQTHPQKPQ